MIEPSPRQFVPWLVIVLLVSLADYAGVVCVMPMAWLLALCVGIIVAQQSSSTQSSRRLTEATFAGGLFGLLQDVLFTVINPAVYYGHPEVDLAYVDYFHPMPEDVFLSYQEILPIDPGFHERRDLWRIYGYLAAVEVEGAPYLGKLLDAVQKYL